MILLLLITIVLSTVLYCILILYYTYFFYRFTANTLPLNQIYNNNTKVSIIIACRNESNCLANLISDINNQSYSKDLFQVIIVDDASTDNTYELAVELCGIYNELKIKVIKLDEDIRKISFKKFAISKAIQHAEGELIITTDADCHLNKDWIKSFSDFYYKTNAKMIVGLVAYHEDFTFFEKLQHLEFLSLIATGIAAVESGYPVMCNGANFAYQKSSFIEVNGFDSNAKYASGDDVFLLLKFKKFYGSKSIKSIPFKSSIVFTKAKTVFSDFVHQRLRWASKTKGYKDFTIYMVAAIVFGFNLIIVICLFLSFYIFKFILISLLLMFVKLLIDFPIMYAITKFLKRENLMKNYLLLAFFYLPYFLLIGVLGNIISYNWKGRKIKN